MGWSTLQEQRLIELYYQDRKMIEGLGRSADANKKKKQAWQKLALTLNVEFGSALDANTVMKKFQNIKTSLRNKQTTNTMSMHKTGGGQGTNLPLTPAEEQLLSFLGDTKAFAGEKQFVESQMVSVGVANICASKDSASCSIQDLEDSPSLEEASSGQNSTSIPTPPSDSAARTSMAAGDVTGKRHLDTCNDGPSKRHTTMEDGNNLVQTELALRIEVLKKMLNVLDKVEMIVDDIIIQHAVPVVISDP
jgi:hypothetical protein